MTTRRESIGRVEEQMSNGGALTQGKQDPPQDNQAFSQEKTPQCDQALVNPPSRMER